MKTNKHPRYNGRTSAVIRLSALLLLSLILLIGCAEGMDDNTVTTLTGAAETVATTVTEWITTGEDPAVITTTGEDPVVTTGEDPVTTTEDPAPVIDPAKLADCEGLVISKVYGNGNNLDAPVEHSFIELYNTTDKEIPLRGVALYYTPGGETDYTSLVFESGSVAAHSFFLVRCNAATKPSKTYDTDAEVIRLDRFDTTWNVTLDNKEIRLLLAPAGLTLTPDVELSAFEEKLSYFVATAEKVFDTGYVDDLTKNKLAVRTALTNDSGYYLVNLDKANKAKLTQIVPSASVGKNTVIRSMLTEVDFSHPAGYYTQEFTLELSAPDGFDVYYTTDGSDPAISKSAARVTGSAKIAMTDTSTAGVGPTWKYISSNKPSATDLPGAHVVRACAKQDDNVTATYTNTYFVCTNVPTYNTAVVSLSMPKEHFWGSDGFYNKTGNYDLNVPDFRATDGMMEIFDENGERRGYSVVELAVSGHGSSGQPMHSMKVYFKKNNNQGGGLESKLHYDIFQGSARNDKDQAITDFSRLLLRSAGNDYYTYMRDGLIQNMCAGLDIDRLAYRQVLLFLNGEFFGVYNIRERYSGEYFEAHHGVDKDNVLLIESDSFTKREGTPCDFVVSSGPEDRAESLLKEFNDLYKFVQTTKLATADQYLEVLSKIDVDSLIELYIAHSYFNATDWPRNNVKVWRNCDPNDPSGFDTKWHFVLLDMDWGISYWNSSNNGDTTEKKNLLSWCDDKSCVMGLIMHYLLKDTTSHEWGKAFRKQFLARYYEVIQTQFQPKQLKPILDTMSAEKSAVFDLLVKRLYKTAGADSQAGTTRERFDFHVGLMYTFINDRPAYAISHMCTYFKVEEVYLMSITSIYVVEALPPDPRTYLLIA